MNDKNVDAVLAGNLMDFGPIIDKYKNRVYSLVLWLLGDSKQAERVTKECFVHVYGRLETYQVTELFSVWLYREILKQLKGNSVSEDGQVFNEERLFYHPHHEKVKEAVLSLPRKIRMPLLLNYLFSELEDRQAADIMDMGIEDYKKSLLLGRKSLRLSVLKTPEYELKSDCLEIEELIQYFNVEKYQKRGMVEDHLEFCPACRAVIEIMEREEKVLEHVLRAPELGDGFNEQVLKQLSPYQKPTINRRSMKYQLGVVGGLVALLLFGVVVIPAIAPWTKMVSNYMNHGSFYNVWADGTYTATSNDIKVEITSVDVDPLHILVHYDVSNDSKDIDYLGENDLFSVHAVDEEGNTYPMESGKPVLIGEMLSSKIPESSNDRSLYVKALSKESLPGEFNLHFHFQRLKGWGGDWKIVVPIEYEKVVQDVEVLELNEVTVIDDKIEVEIISLEKGKYGSRLTYDVRLKAEEIQRIETNLKKTEQKFDRHLYRSHHVFAGVALVNNDEEYLVPIDYPSMYNNVHMQTSPFVINFSNLSTDKNFMEVKGKETEGGKYSAEIRNAYYLEPGFYSMTVPIEKTTEVSLDIDLDGYTLNKLSVTRKEGLPTKVLLIGERTQNHKVRTFSWDFADQNGQRLDIFSRSGYEWFDQEESLELEMINVDVKSEVTHLLIQAAQISNDYIFREKEYRLPLE